MKYAKRWGKLCLMLISLQKISFMALKTKQLEINRPKWMHHALKMYQIAPRFFERCFPKLFKNKA